jgi:hypothetical protein
MPLLNHFAPEFSIPTGFGEHAMSIGCRKGVLDQICGRSGVHNWHVNHCRSVLCIIVSRSVCILRFWSQTLFGSASVHSVSHQSCWSLQVSQRRQRSLKAALASVCAEIKLRIFIVKPVNGGLRWGWEWFPVYTYSSPIPSQSAYPR